METTFEKPLADLELEREAQLRAKAFIGDIDATADSKRETLIRARAFVMEAKTKGWL